MITNDLWTGHPPIYLEATNDAWRCQARALDLWARPPGHVREIGDPLIEPPKYLTPIAATIRCDLVHGHHIGKRDALAEHLRNSRCALNRARSMAGL